MEQAAATSPLKGQAKDHRGDIQGLRALAVSLVLIYHLWPDALPGGFIGVDVFFVISGFLITGHLLATAPSTGGDLVKFWIRRIRRLLPTALLVLASTLVAVRVLVPETQWASAAKHAITSALYVENWRLANDSVDYLAAEEAPSPMQHYWSLSVEEQFYACWPLLVLGCVLLARRFGARLHHFVLGAVSIVLIASLTYSITYTASNPAKAYFVTGTRIWELAAGALLATVVSMRVPRTRGTRGRVDPRRSTREVAVRAGAVWAGVALIAFAALSYDGSDFPGVKALVPILGAVLMLAAAEKSYRYSPNALLCTKPSQYLGDISYSVYLWHWPLILLVPYATDRGLSGTDKVAVLAASIALAAASTRLVEQPLRFARPQVSAWVPLRFAAAGTATVLGLASLGMAEANRRESDQLDQLAAAVTRADSCFGAESMRPNSGCKQRDSGEVVPGAAVAEKDRSFSYKQDCQAKDPYAEVKSCVFGDPKATTNVALVGNSHAVQWLPALQDVAVREGFKITTYFSAGCFANDVRIRFETTEASDGCHRWGQEVLKRTTAGGVDLVVSSERTYMRPAAGGDPRKTFTAGYESYVRNWLKAGVNVLVIRGAPYPEPGTRVPTECIAANPDKFRACAGPRAEYLHPDPLADAVKAIGSKRARVADLTTYFCTETVCPAVIGGVMVYSIGTHLTATYARTAAPALTPHVKKALKPILKAKAAQAAPPAPAPVPAS